MTNFLARPQPSIPEFLFMLFISGMVLGLFTYSDIILNDFYVRPILAECYPSNDSKFCQERRAELGCPATNQMCIGDKYAQVLVVQIWSIGTLMFGVRMFLTYLIGKHITILTFITSTLWGFTAVALFTFGFEDYAYFVTRSIEVPDKLPWLNSTGLFTYTKQFGNDPVNVERYDLYLTMLIGIIVVIILWWLMMLKQSRSVLRALN